MRVLLDTHVLLWAASQSSRLPRPVRELLKDESNELFFSAVSIWEAAIKNALGREDFIVDLREFRSQLAANGYLEVPVTSAHAEHLQALPALHNDPFDRMLVAQAVAEGLTLLTNDEQLARYPGPVRKV